MDSNYVFLCGVMWCRFGQQDAGKELLRAAESTDPDISELAWAMLAKGARRLRELEKGHKSLLAPEKHDCQGVAAIMVDFSGHSSNQLRNHR